MVNKYKHYKLIFCILVPDPKSYAIFIQDIE